MEDEIKKNINIPNFLTALRVLVLPFFIYLLFQKEIHYQIIAFLIFAIASLTDLIDGYLARKWNQETEFGKFLDPLADKFLVIGCFVSFLFIHEQIQIWMVSLIIFRDMLITFLRYVAVQSGISIRTTMMGKVKTTFQMGTIIIILIIFSLITGARKQSINDEYRILKLEGMNTFEIATHKLFQFSDYIQHDRPLEFKVGLGHLAGFLPYFGMLFTTFITVLSGVRYLITNKNLFRWKFIRKAIPYLETK